MDNFEHTVAGTDTMTIDIPVPGDEFAGTEFSAVHIRELPLEAQTSPGYRRC